MKAYKSWKLYEGGVVTLGLLYSVCNWMRITTENDLNFFQGIQISDKFVRIGTLEDDFTSFLPD